MARPRIYEPGSTEDVNRQKATRRRSHLKLRESRQSAQRESRRALWSSPEWKAAVKARQKREKQNARHRAWKARQEAKDPNWKKQQYAYRVERFRQVKEEMAGRPRPKRCELCNKPSARIEFDHDHKTGKFRGWLCRQCNLTLGYVNDDIALLQQMIEYLKKAQS